jgi:hypothetical protein
MARGVIRDIERVPADHPLRAAFLTYYVENSWVSKWLLEAKNEGLSIPHRQPIDGLQGKGTGLGKGSGQGVERGTEPEKGTVGSSLTKDELRADWSRWLEHFHETTGRTAVEGSEEAKRAFKARREEGRTVDELKEATVGCHGDERLRDRGFDRPETILRGSKFERYIELARKTGTGNGSFKSFLDKAVTA